MFTGLILAAAFALMSIALAPAMVRAKGLGQLGEEVVIAATNRTGGALVIGGVYALDHTQSDADSTDAETGAGNVVAVDSGHINCDLVIATDTLADNASGSFIAASPHTQVMVEGTTDVAKGDVLIPVAGQYYLKTQSVTVLTAGCGQAHEARTTNSAGLQYAAFDGRNRWKQKAPAS